MSGQGRGNYVRRQGLKRKRLTKAEMARKRFVAPSQATAVTSRAGVPGAAARMTQGIQQPQEIKTFDTVVTHIGNSTDWSYVLQSSLALIRLGAGSQQRNGRQLRLMGIDVRFIINTGNVTAPTLGQPYSLHMIQDKQANGSTPSINQIYTSANRYSLPDTKYLQRFKWLHSVERTLGCTTANTMVTFNFPCNILISYDADTGLIGDIESNNILMLFSTDSPTNTLTGIVRYNYVDA